MATVFPTRTVVDSLTAVAGSTGGWPTVPLLLIAATVGVLLLTEGYTAWGYACVLYGASWCRISSIP